MDGPESRALQRLDSFWFFANIFSQKRPVVEGASSGDGDREHYFVEEEATLPEKDSKPISPIIEIEQKGGGNEEVETPKGSAGAKRRSRPQQRREIFGELDGAKEGSNRLVLDEVERYSQSPRKGGQNLPPLNVNDMKKHLKSWAYAVACTVK